MTTENNEVEVEVPATRFAIDKRIVVSVAVSVIAVVAGLAFTKLKGRPEVELTVVPDAEVPAA